ncbi:hypothetical protein BGW38_004402 [Lunasporangiospora selenospora]|uniref:type I protein arginine methyltransferase n=1 Tax=Lunasporangiospora selenospora TaxID=979761 RepID=A0A9P6KC24_9FUNG|nr:hypothetical protein BGW38_004402 [Lunasporangiospora selenospora]
MSHRILQASSSSPSTPFDEARRSSTISQSAYAASEYSESEYGDEGDIAWDDWADDDDDNLHVPESKCLFCSNTQPSARETFQHCKTVHGFDFVAIRHGLRLDFYQSIRLINSVRQLALDHGFDESTTVAAAKDGEPLAQLGNLTGKESFLNDDAFLRPVLEDDSLMFEFEDVEYEGEDDQESAQHGKSDRPAYMDDTEFILAGGKVKRLEYSFGEDSIQPTTELEAKLLKMLRHTEEKLFAVEVQLHTTESQFEAYRAQVKESFFDSLLLDDGTRSVLSEVSASGRSVVGDDDEALAKKQSLSKALASVPQDEGNYYFNSYASSDIHQQMLNDRVRTEGYRDYIYENKDVFKGKTVLDVGCGTGILSMFAAKAGAAKVYSVDNSDIIEKARENITENGFENVITLVRGRIEEIRLPCKVDIIISEWMGYFLLYEAMLDSVLVARDRFLAPGGILAPSQTRILFTATNDESFLDNNIHYWSDVYGFKMSSMQQGVLHEAMVDFVSPDTIVTDTVSIKDLPHQTITIEGLDFVTDFALEMQRDDQVSAFVGYFDTWFTRDGQDVPLDVGISKDELKKHRMNGFTTGPVPTAAEETHWKQTMFVLEKAIELKKGDKIRGTFYCKKNQRNPRALDLRIVYEVQRVQKLESQEDEKADLKFFLR